MIYDAHIHCKNQEAGGFIIGTAGSLKSGVTLDNETALKLHAPGNKYIAFYYVTNEECAVPKSLEWKYLKYHGRRERYSPKQVIASISVNHPKAVILDTLNEPYWAAYDYWKVAKEFPDVPFVFAHAGGYLINEFVKICHFQSNVWIDFSYTHTMLGRLGDGKTGLAYANQAIQYSLNASFSDRILLGSDFPFCDQQKVVQYYAPYLDKLNGNFVRLVHQINS